MVCLYWSILVCIEIMHTKYVMDVNTYVKITLINENIPQTKKIIGKLNTESVKTPIIYIYIYISKILYINLSNVFACFLHLESTDLEVILQFLHLLYYFTLYTKIES